MTPKEKAKKLVDRYYTEIHEFLIINNVSERRLLKAAKQCALITVDEIQRQSENWGVVSVRAYWQQLKTEINNL